MDPTKRDLPGVIEKFITAVEETKELLRSPSVPGRPSYLNCDEKPQRKMGISEFSPLSVRLTESDPGSLHRISTKSAQKIDETDFVFEHTSQEIQAQGLVSEMDSLLSQISNAATCLKTIYLRRSSSDYDVRDVSLYSFGEQGFGEKGTATE